jgi:hypothetical protein
MGTEEQKSAHKNVHCAHFYVHLGVDASVIVFKKPSNSPPFSKGNKLSFRCADNEFLYPE